MRPALLYNDAQSVVSFSVIPKCVPLNDLEWLFRVKFCFRACWLVPTVRHSKNNCVKTNKDRHICQQLKSSPWILVSRNIRFARIFAQVLSLCGYSQGFSIERTSNDSVVARHAHVLRSHVGVYLLCG